MTTVSLPRSLNSGSGPLVSVIVPTYGDAEYLPRALESIAAQTHDTIEIVVVDGTGVEWLDRLEKRVEGFVHVRQDPRGLGAARNRGVAASTGEMIALLDADDHWHPAKLEHQLAAIEAGADVVYTDIVVLEDGTERRQSSLPVADSDRHHVDFLLDGGVPILTVLARRECFEVEPFDERLDAVEDRHFLARVFERYRPARVAEPLAYYRHREGSMSSDAEAMYAAERAVLDDLFELFPELEAHREALDARATYAYGRRLLRTGRGREARRVLTGVLADGRRDHRTLALCAVAALPFGHRRALRALETIQERLRR